jgi:hypothetical protein
MSARLTITLSRTSVWLLFLACLFALPAQADRYDLGREQPGFHWRDILSDAARDEVREYRTPQWRSSDGTREYRRVEPRQSYRGEEERRVYRREEGLPRESGNVPDTQGAGEGIQAGVETVLASPLKVVLHPLMVFPRPPGSSGENQAAVYTGKEREMVYARVSRVYTEPNGTSRLTYVEFMGRQGQRVRGWVDDRFLSSFKPQDEPWMGEFVTEGTIMTNPTTNPLSHAISSNVSVGTRARVVGYTSTDQGTWYLLEDSRTGRLRGWTSGTEIQKAEFSEERARLKAAGQEHQVQLEQQQREEADARTQREQAAEQARQEEEQKQREAQQQEQQRAAELAQIERERQQAQASQSRDEVDPQYVTTFPSPWRAVANSTFVFFHPEKNPLVYRGKREEMVFAAVRRKYQRPGLSETFYEVDFDSSEGKHVSGWMYSRYVSPSFSDLSFSDLERPWPAEFVVSGSIRPQPSDSVNDGDALHYGVRPGTQVEAIGYANTDRGTWYLARWPNSHQLAGWVQAGQIQDVGTLARMAAQRAAEQRREALEQQQAEAMLRALPSRAFVLYLVLGVVLALVPQYRHFCEERVNTAGGIGAFMRERILSLLAFMGFVAMVVMGIGSAGAGIVALVLLAVGIRAGAYVPWLIFAVFEYLHYLFVPHPMESPVDKAMTKHDPSKARLGEVADAMFNPNRDELPPEWQSENYAQRLAALEKRIRGEKAAADSLSEYLRKKSGEQAR